MLVKMFQPNSVRRASTLAKMYEASSSQSVTSATPVIQNKSTTNDQSLLGETPVDLGSENKDATKTTTRPGRCGINVFQGYFDDDKESRVKQIPMIQESRFKIQEPSFKNQDSRIIKLKIQGSRFKNQEKTQSR